MMEKMSLAERRMAKPGILRLDLGRPRKTSAISFEMDSILAPQAEVEPVSPQLSVDRLSVTFAGEEKSPEPNEKVSFHQKNAGKKANVSDDEDYSATFNAFMTRQESRGSRKRRTSKRRGSSPFSPDPESYENLRRQSSVVTNSSEAAAMEDTKVQEQIFHKMRVHKEVLSQVKHQPWPMHRKLKLVRTAKAYIKRHEGALHERLAHNKSTKDVLAHFNIIMVNQWHYLKREIVNLSKFLIPWESSIKEIESHFGSVVASYFTFLRWLFSINLVTAIVLITFVCIPEVFMASKEDRGERKGLLPSEEKKSKNLLTLWNFEGILKYSPMFYGYYNTQGSGGFGFWYRIPHAYFMTGLGVYIYSFVAILRKMAENSRQSKLSEKDDECTFSWKIFTGWDYMIGNAETAHNRTASIILGFKEALLEEEEKKRDQGRNWKMTTLRIFTHLMVLCLIFTSVYVVILVVRRSTEPDANSSWWRQSEVTIVVTLIGFLYPILFDGIGILERYHPRKALRMQLARIMVLNLLNLYSFIFATFSKISTMSVELRELAAQFKNVTKPIVGVLNATTTTSPITEVICRRVEVDCQVTTVKAITVALLLNLTSTENVTIPMDYEYDYNNTLSYPNDMYEYNATNVTGDGYNVTSDGFNVTNVTGDGFNATGDGLKKCWVQRCVDLEGNVTETDLERFNWNVTGSTLPTISATTAPDDPNPNRSRSTKELDLTTRKRLRQLCWETMFGQELVKLTLMDMVITVASVLFDFFRALFVRTMNNCWCWDLEKRFPQYGDFKIAENILHLVNNQGMVWMGMFFSPGLPLINLLKLAIVMHMRSWAVLTCNVPHEVVFKASRSNNFYFALLLTMLFLCVLPVGYAVVWVEPSWHCGPFSNHNKIYHIFTSTLKKVIPSYLHKVLDYIASPGIVIPLLMLLILIIYYLISLTNALREANDDLKIQLRRERTEERRKVFQLAEKRRKGGDIENSFNKWRRIINSVPEPKTPIDFSEIKSDSQDHTDSDKKEVRQFFKRRNSNDSDEGIPQVERDSKPKGIHNIIKSVLRSKKPEGKVYREREDSTVSGWSADIPEIKIIETDPTPAIKEASSSETVIALEDEIKKPKSKNHDEDESLGIGESYESIAESIRIIHDLTNEGTQMRKIKARKAIANALVNEVRRRKMNEP